MQTWGSLRWATEWFEKNRSLVPEFTWPEQTDRVKVLLMVPKWANRVHEEEAVDLVRQLTHLEEVSVALMGHPRKKEGSVGPLLAAPGIDWDRLHDVSGTNSVSAIAASDVVIDAGSSIGIEVVMQGKVLLNPAYIHELTTLFDTIDDVAVVAGSTAEAVEYLREHAAGRPHRPPADATSQLLCEAVYGSREAPFDVLDEYSTRIRSLTTQGAS
jgi:hypothetical protein